MNEKKGRLKIVEKTLHPPSLKIWSKFNGANWFLRAVANEKVTWQNAFIWVSTGFGVAEKVADVSFIANI